MQALLKNSTETLITVGANYVFSQPEDEQTPEVVYPYAALLNMTDPELLAIDLVWTEIADPDPPAITADQVYAEMNRRLAMGMDYYSNADDFVFIISCDDENYAALQGWAIFAIDRRLNYSSTVVPGYLMWVDFTTEFTLPDIGGAPMKIDAFNINYLQFNATERRKAMKAAADTLIAMEVIPQDYTDNDNWPDLAVGDVGGDVGGRE